MRKASSSPRFPGCPSTIPEIAARRRPDQARRGPLEAHHVIDVEIARGEPPFVAERAVDDAHRIGQGEAVRADRRRHLRGLQEAAPVMGPRLQPAQQIFGPEDGKGEGFRRPVEGREDEQPAGRHQRRGGRHEAGHIADMLDDLHGEDDLEARAGLDQRLGGLLPVIDLELALLGMAARRGDAHLRRIDAGHRGTHARQRLREQPAAAADIHQGEPGQRPGRQGLPPEAGGGPVADIGETDRIQPVQRAELSGRIPPALCQGRKLRDFRRVDRSGERRVNSGIGERGGAGHGAQSTFAGLA